MADRNAARSEMEYTVMDARNLEHLPDGCFDLVIDKAMLDSQLCSSDNIRSVSSTVREMHRVLKPGGAYLCISHGTPPTRLGHLSPKGMDWSVEYSKVKKQSGEGGGAADGEHHYVYVCRKPDVV